MPNHSLTRKAVFERTFTPVRRDSKSASIGVKRSHGDSVELFSKAESDARIRRIRSAFYRSMAASFILTESVADVDKWLKLATENFGLLPTPDQHANGNQ